MIMGWFLYGAAWAICGAASYACWLAYLQREFPQKASRDRRSDVLWSALIGALGPGGLILMIVGDLLVYGRRPFRHGMLLWPAPAESAGPVTSAQWVNLAPMSPKRGSLDDWSRSNWDRVPESQRRRCLDHLRDWVPKDVLSKWREQHSRGERIGWDVPGFHFGGGMSIRNRLRAVLSDGDLPPASTPPDAASAAPLPGPGESNWDDFYTGALEELVEGARGADGSGRVYCILGGGGAFGIQTALYLLDNASPRLVVGVGRSPMRPAAFSLGIEGRDRYSYRQFHIVNEHDKLIAYLDQLRPDVIINFAAQGEGAASWRDSWRFFDTNATALCRLHEILENREWFKSKACRFIHIGTSELYGSVTEPAREDYPITPSSPYAASKAAFDLYLLSLRRSGRGLTSHILRPSNCYCPGQLLHRIIPRAMVAGLTGRRVPLHGGGAARKSYMHVRDLARAIHLLSSAPDPAPVYNAGPDTPISISTLAEMCAQVCGLRLEELFDVAPERVGQDACYWLDSFAIRRDLGWVRTITLPEGLLEVHRWAEENLEQLRDWPTDYQLRP